MSFFFLRKKGWKIPSLLYILFSIYESFGSGFFQESFIEDVRGIGLGKQPIQNIFEYNEKKYAEINPLKVGYTNFASVRVFYKKKGSHSFEGLDIPQNVYFVSGEQKVGDETVVLHKVADVGKTEEVINSYQRRGNILSSKKLENGQYSVRITGELNDKKFYPLNLLKYHQYNPFYPVLAHSEQHFLDYFLFEKSLTSIISQDVVDCILINIVSTNAACNHCYTALETLLLGKNGIKKEFVSKAFPNTDLDVPIHILYNAVNDSSHRKKERNILKSNPQKNIDLSDGKIHFINTEFGAYLKKQSLINKPQLLQKMFIEEEIEDKSSMMILKQEQLSKENIEFLLSLNPNINLAFEEIKKGYLKNKTSYKKKHSSKKNESPKRKSRSRSRDKETKN